MVSGFMTVALEFIGFCLIVGGIFTCYLKCCERNEASVGKRRSSNANAKTVFLRYKEVSRLTTAYRTLGGSFILLE